MQIVKNMKKLCHFLYKCVKVRGQQGWPHNLWPCPSNEFFLPQVRLGPSLASLDLVLWLLSDQTGENGGPPAPQELHFLLPPSRNSLLCRFRKLCDGRNLIFRKFSRYHASPFDTRRPLLLPTLQRIPHVVRCVKVVVKEKEGPCKKDWPIEIHDQNWHIFLQNRSAKFWAFSFE